MSVVDAIDTVLGDEGYSGDQIIFQFLHLIRKEFIL